MTSPRGESAARVRAAPGRTPGVAAGGDSGRGGTVPDEDRAAGAGRGRAPRGRPSAGLLAGLLVAAAVLATALAGPLAVRWHGPPAWLDLEWQPPAPPPTMATPAPIGPGDENPEPQLPAWVGDVVRVLVIALVAGLVTFAVVLVVRALRERWRAIDKAARAAAEGAGAQASDELDEAARAELEQGVEHASRALRAALPPGDAVVAAWLALERAAAASGIERAPAATASEFTLALLDRSQADPRAARTLLGLYHRARFSDHEVLPDDVTAAAAALDVLAAALARAVVAGAADEQPAGTAGADGVGRAGGRSGDEPGASR